MAKETYDRDKVLSAIDDAFGSTTAVADQEPGKDDILGAIDAAFEKTAPVATPKPAKPKDNLPPMTLDQAIGRGTPVKPLAEAAAAPSLLPSQPATGPGFVPGMYPVGAGPKMGVPSIPLEPAFEAAQQEAESAAYRKMVGEEDAAERNATLEQMSPAKRVALAAPETLGGPVVNPKRPGATPVIDAAQRLGPARIPLEAAVGPEEAATPGGKLKQGLLISASSLLTPESIAALASMEGAGGAVAEMELQWRGLIMAADQAAGAGELAKATKLVSQAGKIAKGAAPLQVAHRAVSTLFTAQMAAGAYQNYTGIRKAVDAGDWNSAAEQLGEAIPNVAFTALGAKEMFDAARNLKIPLGQRKAEQAAADRGLPEGPEAPAPEAQPQPEQPPAAPIVEAQPRARRPRAARPTPETVQPVTSATEVPTEPPATPTEALAQGLERTAKEVRAAEAGLSGEGNTQKRDDISSPTSDALLPDLRKLAEPKGGWTTVKLQRQFGIGYGRASNLLAALRQPEEQPNVRVEANLEGAEIPRKPQTSGEPGPEINTSLVHNTATIPKAKALASEPTAQAPTQGGRLTKEVEAIRASPRLQEIARDALKYNTAEQWRQAHAKDKSFFAGINQQDAYFPTGPNITDRFFEAAGWGSKGRPASLQDSRELPMEPPAAGQAEPSASVPEAPFSQQAASPTLAKKPKTEITAPLSREWLRPLADKLANRDIVDAKYDVKALREILEKKDAALAARMMANPSVSYWLKDALKAAVATGNPDEALRQVREFETVYDQGFNKVSEEMRRYFQPKLEVGQAPRATLMEKAPPGGFTEADKVPEKYRKPVTPQLPTGAAGATPLGMPSETSAPLAELRNQVSGKIATGERQAIEGIQAAVPTEFGTGQPEEAESTAPEVRAGSGLPQEAPGETPAIERVKPLIERFQKAIQQKNLPTDPRELRAMAQQAVGGNPAEYVDDIYDSLEGATSEALQRSNSGSLADKIERADVFENNLGKRTRTIEITKLQQFSTPLPLSEAVAYAGDVHKGDIVLEPTAGTGNLIQPIEHQQGSDVTIRAVELDPRRVAVLRALGYDVTQGDYLRSKERADVIVTNPPWGKISTGRYAHLNIPAPWGKFGDVSERFLVKNLNDLNEGGRLVAVVPTTILSPESNGFRKWINQNHTLRAMIQSPPGAYTQRGTSVDSILLVVDKGHVDAGGPIMALDADAPKDYREYTDLVEPLAQGGTHARASTATTTGREEPANVGSEAVSRPENGVSGRVSAGEGVSAGHELRPSAGELRPGSAGVGSDVVSEEPSGQRAGIEPTATPQLVRQGPRALRPTGVAPERVREFEEASSSPIFAPYGVRSGAHGTPHPRQVVETRTLAGAPAPELTYQPSAGVKAAHQRGTISDEQYDAVVVIGQANEAGYAALVADDVGLGKSRELGARALDLVEQHGAKRILITTAGEANLRDLENELKLVWGVGPSEKLPVRYMLLRDFKESAERTTAASRQWQELPKFPNEPVIYGVEATNLAAYRRAIEDLNPDGILADEAHKYKNIEGAQVGAAWKALSVGWLKKKVPTAYFTATPATMIDELEYLYGLREWAPNGFGDWVMLRTGRTTEAELRRLAKEDKEEAPQDISAQVGSEGPDIAATGKRGVFSRSDVFSSPVSSSEMEQIMRELKMRGKYVSRDLWRGGVEFNQVEHPLTDKEKEKYSKAIDFMRAVDNAWWTWGKMNAASGNRFGPGSQLQFAAKRLLFDLRLDRALVEARKAVDRGEQAVISLINVNETKEGEGNVWSALASINTKHVEVDDDGDITDLGEIPEAIAKKQELVEQGKRDFPPSPDPIKKIQDEFGKSNVAIVTGSEAVKDRRRAMDLFQAGEKRVIVISGAGKTGINLHHIKNLEGGGAHGRRHLIVVDYEWSATAFKQELGRVDRAGQLTPPKISMLTLGSAAEKKFISTIANRMRSQGAVSKGAGESGTAEPLEHFELGGDFDNLAVREAWSQLPVSLKEYFRGSKFMERQRDGSQVPRRQITGVSVKDFMLQLQLIPIDEGNDIWNTFWETRERLLTGEAAEERSARKTQRTKGDITRRHELQPDLSLYEVKDAGGSRSGILVGMITDKMDLLRDFITPEGGRTPKREYTSFTANDGTQISGLRIAPGQIKGVAKAFGKKVAYAHTPMTAVSDLLAGDKIPLVNGWTLRAGQGGERKGYVIIDGASMSNTDRGKTVLPHGGGYNAVSGGFFHVGKIDAENVVDRLNKFFERFPIKIELAEGEERASELEGPGTPARGQTDVTGSPLRQLTEAIGQSTSQGSTPAERLREAVNMGKGLERVKTAVQSAFEAVKSVAAAFNDMVLRPPDFSNYKTAKGEYGLAIQRAAHELNQFVTKMKREFPLEHREGMAAFVEAGGDDGKLREWAAASDAANAKPYKAALSLTDAEQATARNIHSFQNERAEYAIDQGIIEHAVENYVMHVWERQNKFTRGAVNVIKTRMLQPNPNFARKRVFPTFFDGEQAGYKAKSRDIAELAAAHEYALTEAVAARAFIKALLTQEAKDGRPLAAVSGSGHSVQGPQSDEQKAYFINPKTKPEQIADYRTIEHPALRKWKWVSKDDQGNPVFMRGDLVIHPEVYRDLKNVLGTSFLRSWNIPGTEVAPFNVALKLSTEFKNTLLSLSLFHQTQTTLHGLEHRVNPLHLTELNLGDSKQAGLVRGGLQIATFNGKAEFSEGLSGSGLVQRLPGIGPYLQDYQNYLFGSYIPRLKITMALDALERNTKRYPDLTPAQLYELTARQANAAFGEQNYLMMGRNKTLQDALRLGLLAPDFLESRARFVGQAVKPYGREQLVALILGAAVLYVGSRILNQLLDQDPHWAPEDAFSVMANGKEYGLRTIQGDVLHLFSDPRGFVYNRLNPVYGRGTIEAITGRDQYGRKRTVGEQISDLIKGGMPIPTQGFMKANPSTVGETLLTSTGVSTYDYKSPAARLAGQYVRDSIPDTEQSPAQEAASRTTSQLVNNIRNGKEQPGALKDALDKGEITKAQFQRATSELTETPLETDVRRMGIEQALAVWAKATPEERSRIAPLLIFKANSLGNRTPAERAQLLPKLDAIFSDYSGIKVADVSMKDERKSADKELARLGEDAMGTVPTQITIDGTPIKLTNQERVEYQQMRVGLFRKVLDKITPTEEYQQLSDEDKKAEIDDVAAEIQRFSRDQMLARIADRRLKRQQATTVPMELH